MIRARHHQSTMRTFGRGRLYSPASEAASPPLTLTDDARLFALTFAGGFLFMTVFLA